MRNALQVAGALLAATIGQASAQSDDAIARGEYLARASNCVACHSVPGGQAFAGGLKMATPIGAIYVTNITPDKEHGIGSYSVDDFDKAVRYGVAKDGHRLYPAMPYPSYSKMTRADVEAMYAFFMNGVPAASVPNKPSEIPSPLNMRWPLAIWNVLFVDLDEYEPDAGQSEAWNRGAYLVQGAGHCGACHTPRGLAWNEAALDDSDDDFLSGAMLDHWSASNLRQDNAAGLGRWSQDDIAEYLKTGHNQFGTAYGTMVEVINNSTQYLTGDDMAAVATYLKSLPGVRSNDLDYAYDGATTEALLDRKLDQPGALTYVQHCKHCHADNGMGYGTFLPSLAGNTSTLDPDPSSLINITLNGSGRLVVEGLPDSYRMPPFRVLLNDQQIADVVSFIRSGWGNTAGKVSAEQVKLVRSETSPASERIEILKMK
ncbi:MAG: cytochrome c [Rhodobacteraceae bacterium]|nr:cytochrome c [Paracoccaceae bacterium]